MDSNLDCWESRTTVTRLSLGKRGEALVADVATAGPRMFHIAKIGTFRDMSRFSRSTIPDYRNKTSIVPKPNIRVKRNELSCLPHLVPVPTTGAA